MAGCGRENREGKSVPTKLRPQTLLYWQVYNRVSQEKGRSFPERLHRFHQRDPVAGKLYVFALALMYIFYLIICCLQPQKVLCVHFCTVTFLSATPTIQDIEVMPDATPPIPQSITPQQNEM